MAKQVQITLTDDLSGGEATATVPFSYRGQSYEIDLNDKNATAFDKAMEKWTEKARKPERAPRGPGRPRGSSNAKPEREFNMAALREWAAENDIKLPARGRISGEIVAKYKASGGK